MTGAGQGCQVSSAPSPNPQEANMLRAPPGRGPRQPRLRPDLKINQIKVEGTQYTIMPSSFPDSYSGMQRLSAPGLRSFNRLVRAMRKRNVGKECSCGRAGGNGWKVPRRAICGWPCSLPGLPTWPGSTLAPPIIMLHTVCVPH